VRGACHRDERSRQRGGRASAGAADRLPHEAGIRRPVSQGIQPWRRRPDRDRRSARRRDAGNERRRQHHRRQHPARGRRGHGCQRQPARRVGLGLGRGLRVCPLRSELDAEAYIKASNTQSSDKFGFALALSGDGNTLAVGATLEDSAARRINGDQADNAASSAGAVYVFSRTRTTWAQQAYIKASNADAGDQFGWSVALSHDGSTLAVGAQSEGSAATGINGNQADNSAPDAGAAYVFVRRGSAWSQQAYIKASNAQGGDRFGFCLALSGDGHTLGVCGYDEDGGAKGVDGVMDEGAPGSGAAYVFVRRGTAWTQDAYLKASNTIRAAAFGSAIAVSADGGTLAVGAADEDGLSRGVDGDQSTTANDDGSAGAVYVYGRTTAGWRQQAYVKSFNIGPTDLFGIRLALSRDGSVLAAGAPGQTGGGRGVTANPEDFSAPESGAAYVFVRSGGRWTQHAYLKAPNADAFDQFGSGVALSADGATLAAAANGDDSGSGIDGDQSDNAVRDAGAVYVY
jgi:hypothetical protein